MKESKDRTEQFMYSAAAAAQHPPSNPFPQFFSGPSTLLIYNYYVCLDSVLFNPGPDSRQEVKGKGRAVPDGELLAVDLNTAESGVSNGNPFQQLQLVEQQVRREWPNSWTLNVSYLL